MGRNNRPTRVPQRARTNLVSDKELQFAIRDKQPRTFGIRRGVEEGQQGVILHVLNELQDQGDIPDTVKLRKSLHVTLLPKRTLNRHTQKGLVAGYELGKMSRRLVQNVDWSDEAVNADISDIRIYKGRGIFMGLQSPEIEKESEEIYELLGRIGVRGFARPDERVGLHISLGDARGGMSRTEQRHVSHVIRESLPESLSPVQLQEWEVYPNRHSQR